MLFSGNNIQYPDVVIILTDGRSNVPIEQALNATCNQAMACRNQGIHIIAVGVGDEINVRELNCIANMPVESNVFTVRDFRDLEDIVTNIVNLDCDSKSDNCAISICNVAYIFNIQVTANEFS